VKHRQRERLQKSQRKRKGLRWQRWQVSAICIRTT